MQIAFNACTIATKKCMHFAFRCLIPLLQMAKEKIANAPNYRVPTVTRDRITAILSASGSRLSITEAINVLLLGAVEQIESPEELIPLPAEFVLLRKGMGRRTLAEQSTANDSRIAALEASVAELRGLLTAPGEQSSRAAEDPPKG